jgi:transcriptional regulator of heat shock response
MQEKAVETLTVKIDADASGILASLDVVSERIKQIKIQLQELNAIAAPDSAMTVNNTWDIGGGVTRKELADLIPIIEARTTATTLSSIRELAFKDAAEVEAALADSLQPKEG